MPNRGAVVGTVTFIVATCAAIALAVVLVRTSAGTDPPREPIAGQVPTGSLPASPTLDPCVIGLWEIVEFRSTFDVGPAVVQLSLLPGSIYRVHYGADGTGTGTFEMVLEGSTAGYRVEEFLEGEATFRFTTSAGNIARTGEYRNSTYVSKINGEATSVEPLSSFPDAVTYSCAGDRLEHRGDDFSRRFRRTTHE
jgi:hypothetical protein